MMGQHTNAILFFGYVWDEETSQPWTIGKDVEDEGDGKSDGKSEGENELEDDGDWETFAARWASRSRPVARSGIW